MPTKKTKLGTAGTNMLKRRTGGEALDVVHPRPHAATKARPTADGYMITTIRFASEDWAWLRHAAVERALETGRRADASELVRELVADAKSKAKAGR